MAVAAVAALTTSTFVASSASAVEPLTVTGTTAVRLVSWGPLEAPLGITIPEDAIILKIVIETYDDYDAFGAPADQFRDTANQKQEQVVLEIGGQRIGSLTDDVPELGPGGDRRKAYQTTVTFEGERKVKGGPVTVQHSRNASSPNSVQVGLVTITYLAADSGGYPPNGGGVEDDDEEENEEEDLTPGQGVTTTTPPQVASGAVTTAAPTNKSADTSSSLPPAVLSSGITAGTTATTTPTAVASAAVVAGGTLPVTGSDSFDAVRLGVVLALAGLGMVFVAGVRRRNRSLSAN